MGIDKIYTQNEVAAAVKEKLDETKVDSFRFRIMRRHSPHALAEQFAVFDGATYEHLTNPEAWLNPLGGGGHYEISVYHESDKGKLIAAPYKVTFPGTYYIRPKGSVIQSPTWVGPTNLLVPKLEELIAASDAPSNTPATPAQAASPLPTTSVGGPTVPALQQVIAAPVSRVEAVEANRLLSVSSELSRQEKELAKREAALEAEAREARLRADFQKMIPAPAPSGGMSSEGMMLKFAEMQMNNMQMMMKMQEDSNNRQMEMLRKVSERPAVDPNLQILLDRIDKKGEKMEEFKAVTEMMGTMATTTMQIIQSNAELMAASQGPQESPGFKLARQALVSLGGIINKTTGNPTIAALPSGEEAPPPTSEASEQQPPPTYSQLELLERAIMRGDPDAKIIARFLKALKSKKFNKYVMENHQGDLMKLVEARLGEWAMEEPEHMQFLQEIAPKMFQAGIDAGLIPRPPASPPVAATPAETNGHKPLKKRVSVSPTPTDEIVAPPVKVEA